LVHHGFGIPAGTDADVIAFDGANESLGHSIALRTFDGCRSRFKTDVASEATRIAGDVAAAVVRKPFDGDR
jgi:hypothetical protein